MRLSSGLVRCVAVALLALFLALAPAVPAQAMTSGSDGSFWSVALEWVQSVFGLSTTDGLPDLRQIKTNGG